MLRHRIPFLLVLVSIQAILIACSANSPVIPSATPADLTYHFSTSNHGRSLWGMWEFTVDLENSEISALPLRSSDMHFNVVPLMAEGTPQSAISFSNLLIDSSSRILQVDISLTHPLPTYPQTAGFDVRGILFTKGDDFNLSAADVIMAGPTEPRLANADGYTRWWNPTEFPLPGLMGYIDGFYGTKDSIANYGITLAGYKYYTDSLSAMDTLADMDIDERGVFRAGATNTRRYLIEFGSEPGTYLIFNYAVDANWGKIPGFGPGSPPPNVPDDFPLTANCPEPYRIRITESSNTLLGSTMGGTSVTVNLNIDIFDWQALDPLSTVPMEVSIVQVEVPIFGLGPAAATVVPGSGAGGHMSTYTASISGGMGAKLDYVDMIITASSWEGDYQQDITGFLGADPLQAFYVHRAKVTDNDAYSGWTHRYTRLLYPEYPNQGGNSPDIAVYKYLGNIRAAMVDQVNFDPDGDGDHAPDSINEWSNDYQSYSLPEHYHMPLSMLSGSGFWDDIRGICVSDTSTRFFLSVTNTNDEFTDGETEPLYSYFSWVSHVYLGNAPAGAWNTVFFSAGDFPRFWATDPSNGVSAGTGKDYVYTAFLYDVTGMSGSNPAPDPQRYIIMRWAPPYQPIEADADWQRPLNVPPNGEGTGYVDRDEPYNHRLAVDDSTSNDRFYILDTQREIEVVDCDFSMGEFSGSFPIGTVTQDDWSVEMTDIVDLEVVQTKNLGALRNHVAALCKTTSNQWRLWVFDYSSSLPVGSQAVTQWLSEPFDGIPYAIDAADDPIEAHVLFQLGGLTYVAVFRDYP